MTQKPGKITICITTYNRPLLLRELLYSIEKQSYRNFEAVITDNSDNSETEEMIGSISFPWIQYYKNEKNIGMAQNALKAFSFVDGEYMTFTPDDDLWIDSNKLEKQISFLNQNNNINIVYSNAESISYSGKVLSPFGSLYGTQFTGVISATELLPGAKTKYFLNILTAMIRTIPLLKIFNEGYHFGSEEYMCYYISACEEKIGFIAEKLVALREAEHYREILKNGKLVDWSKKKDERINQIIAIYGALTRLHPSSEQLLATRCVHSFLMRHLYRTARSSKNPLLVLKTIAACSLVFEKADWRFVFSKQAPQQKSFG